METKIFLLIHDFFLSPPRVRGRSIVPSKLQAVKRSHLLPSNVILGPNLQWLHSQVTSLDVTPISSRDIISDVNDSIKQNIYPNRPNQIFFVSI